MTEIGQIRSKVKYYAYWNRKSQFSIETAIYEKWCGFAVEDGEFAYRIGDATGRAMNGDLVLCPPGVPFQRNVVLPLSFHYFYIDWVHIATGELVSDPEELLAALPRKAALAQTNRLKSSFAFLRSFPHIGAPEHVLRWIGHLLDDLLFLYVTEQQLVPMHTKRPSSDPLMDQAALAIKLQAFSEISLLQVAASFGLTPVQFSRRFTSAYKISPLGYLTSLRLERAGQLLQETDLNLEEIAEKCGYRNGSYISRLFASKLGIPPSEFRKKHRL
ncbi:helix-turn-helix domain-containing protein [Paenibacillus hodogayensis]|uniref:Helix-turn-helix domain-containing protein n=1 Tax=Paenibacillus hodogayensis TaxID=279208 RepID=A0ABV5VVF9_9BACL